LTPAAPGPAGEGPDRRARVLVIVVGDELLDGSVADRNGAALARAVRSRGGEVAGIVLVGDEEEAIAAAVEEGLERADGVLACGGIGPTGDDVTREAVARALETDLVVDEGWAGRVAERFPPARGLPGTARQARLPRGSEPVDNPTGTALGFGADAVGRGWVLVLPGVPDELRAMLGGSAGSFLDARIAGSADPVLRVGLAGVAESVVAERLEGLGELEGLRVASYPHQGTVDLHLRAVGAGSRPDEAGAARERLARAGEALRREFGRDVYEVGERELAEVVLDVLRERGETLAVAESCTGGGLGSALTAVAGASDVFWGGVITYADEAKRALVGVPEAVLRSDGAVSEATVRAMARGVREVAGASWGVAITGIAGPSGGSAEKPVGTVWIAGTGEREAVRRFRMPGGRSAVRRRSVTAALDMVRRLAAGEG